MPSWFDYLSFTFSGTDKIIDETQLAESTKIVTNFALKEIKDHLGGDSSKLWIGGFSQGGAMTF